MKKRMTSPQSSDKAILVTGAAGFLGSLLMQRLVAEGHRVTALDYEPGASLFGRTVEYVQVDLTDVTRAREVLIPWRWNAVINLAGSFVRGGETCQESYSLIRSHTAIALNLCLCIPEQWRGPFIHASSMTVYGMPQRQPVDEHHPRLPLDGYGMAKALAEDMLCSWWGRYASNCWLLRFPGLFSEDRHSGALYHFIRSAHQGNPLVISASKPTPWDVLHVSDAVEAIMRALRTDCHGPGPINISYGEAVELEQIARLIVKITQSKSEVQNPSNIRHPVFQMDISRARQLLNWPPCTLRQRLEQLCIDITSKADAVNVT